MYFFVFIFYVLDDENIYIKELMSHFVYYKIQYSNHLNNMEAHKLTRHAWHVNDVAI